MQELADSFAARVTELSGGRLRIESYTGGSIVEPFEVLQATSVGVLDCYHSWPGYWLEKIPSGPFFGGDAPFPSGPVPWITWMYHGGGEGLMLEAWQDAGYNVGAVMVLGLRAPEVFAWSNKPLKKLDDFQRLTCRISGYWVEVLKGMGADVVTLPGDEVLPALEKGVIDAAEWGVMTEDWDVGLQHVVDYAVLTAFRQAHATFEFAVNKDSWEALPPDLQELIRSVCKEYTWWYLLEGTYRDVLMLDKLEKTVTVITLDKEVPIEMFRLLSQHYGAIAAEDDMTAKALESARAFHNGYYTYSEAMYPYGVLVK